MDVVIPYRPRPWALRVHNNLSRYRVLVCHRAAGKTVFAVNDLIRDALTGPPQARYLYILPQQNQAKRSVWDMHVENFCRKLPQIHMHRQSMTVTFHNGAKLLIMGSDDPENLRGLHVHGIVLDEVDDMHPEVWTVVRPTLMTHTGRCCFIGTPKGKKRLYDYYQWGQNPEYIEWTSELLTWRDTGVISSEEIESLRQEFSPEKFSQELECDFESANVGAYYGRQLTELREQGRIKYFDPPLYRPDLEVHSCWDLGIRDHMAVWWYQLVGETINFIDYEEAGSMGFPEWGAIFENRTKEYGYRYGDFVAPFDIRNRELGTGISREESGAQFGLYFVRCPDQGVADGIELVRQTLHKCQFDLTRCDKGVEALRAYRSKLDNQGHPVGPLHDWSSHSADSLRYGITWIEQVVNRPAPMRMPIRRM
jgi:hypothetical protein